MFMINILRGPFILLLSTLTLARMNRKKRKTDTEGEKDE
jgi:hypothetical protein